MFNSGEFSKILCLILKYRFFLIEKSAPKEYLVRFDVLFNPGQEIKRNGSWHKHQAEITN